MVTPNMSIGHHFRLLKNADPRLYDRLIELLAQRVSEITVAVTLAPPDQILVCQGRAQEAMKMMQIMMELPEDNPVHQPPVTRPGP